MFCNAQISKYSSSVDWRKLPAYHNIHLLAAQSDEQRAKLSKLLSLWESKGNFFDACVISKLKAPTSSLQDYQNSLLTQYAAIVAQITQATKVTFDKYALDSLLFGSCSHNRYLFYLHQLSTAAPGIRSACHTAVGTLGKTETTDRATGPESCSCCPAA